jgi:hypothetical protein
MTEILEEKIDDTLSPSTISDLDILCADFPDPNWIVPGIFPEGLTIFGGKPKAGKSTLCLGLAHTIASGGKFLGKIQTAPQEVLYLALEELPRRLKPRLIKMLNGATPTGKIHFSFQWPKIDQGGLEKLDGWLKDHSNVKLVIIDTLARLRGIKRQGSSVYEADYNEIASLKEIADNYSAAFIVVHHLRKADSYDVLDLVSGSVGLTAAADTIAILQKAAGLADSELYLSGRDIEEVELALKFHKETKSFSILGEAEEYRMSLERRELLELLRKADGPLQLKDIASGLGKEKNNVSKLLNGLIEYGLAEQPAYGMYQACDKSGESGESGESLRLFSQN